MIWRSGSYKAEGGARVGGLEGMEGNEGAGGKAGWEARDSRAKGCREQRPTQETDEVNPEARGYVSSLALQDVLSVRSGLTRAMLKPGLSAEPRDA